MIIIIFYDFEVFEYDWLAVFIDVTNRKEHVIINDKDKLRTLYERNMSNIWVGFNNRHYDQYIMKGILLGMDPKKINDWIIVQEKEGWQYSRVFNKLPMIKELFLLRVFFSFEMLRSVNTEVRVFLRLPCANFNNWFFRVVYIDHEEQITFVTIV